MDLALIKDGEIKNIIVADYDWAVQTFPDYTVVEKTPEVLQQYPFVPLAPSSLVPPKRILTKYEFRKRFTMNELVQMDNLPTFIQLTPTQLATYNTFQKNFDAATEIDLDNPDVIAGLDFLVTLGVLTPERVAQIRS